MEIYEEITSKRQSYGVPIWLTGQLNSFFDLFSIYSTFW